MEGRVDRYGAVARWLHWIVAGLIVLQYVLANLAEAAEEAGALPSAIGIFANHKSVGITILVLALFRLGWRFAVPPPPLPALPAWQRWAAHAAHALLYGLILLLPVSGWMLSSAAAFPVSWFGLVTLPDLLPAHEPTSHTLESVHELLARLLWITALIHLLAALVHHLLHRDAVLVRMASWSGGVVLVALPLVGAFWLGSGAEAQTEPTASQATAPASAVPVDAGTESAGTGPLPPRWQIDYTRSEIRFYGRQAGAEFEGRFRNWEADIRFDPDRLDASSARVRIDVASVDTGNGSRDDTLRSASWFGVTAFPQARYVATDFSEQGESAFAAAGELIIRERAHAAPLEFELRIDGEQRQLTGTAQLRRLALGLGSGQWTSTTQVADEVRVEVRVEAIVPR